MAISTAPASIAEFFRLLADLVGHFSNESARQVRKYAKAFGLLEDEGFMPSHPQVIIDDRHVSRKIVGVLELHRNNPHVGWYNDLMERVRTYPWESSTTNLSIPILTDFMTASGENVSKYGRIGLIAGWYLTHFWDIPGMTEEILEEIEAKLLLLGFPPRE